MNNLLETEITINGSPKLVITAKSELGKSILDAGFNKIEVTKEVTTILGKVVPAGSLILSYDTYNEIIAYS